MNSIISPEKFDVIIVGGGHAGCEAALAASRMNCTTLLLTMNLDTIAQMSCNPAIGGPGKGHLAREIDALGGDMAKVIDKSAIQFRMLNTKKGPAVRAPRAQADKQLYSLTMKQALEQQPLLALRQELVDGLLIKDRCVAGVRTTTNIRYYSRVVVICAGTFLNGLIHIGEKTIRGGRISEMPSIGLAKEIKRQGFRVGRLKTGTPARVHTNSIDFSCFMPQKGDQPPCPFSYDTEKIYLKQLLCYLGYTNKKTHLLIKNNLHRSPLYSGKIKGIGVRYCPSIEDKVVKFPDKDKHQIFLEPEGRNTCEIYLNGLSTSLPPDVQLKMLQTIPGLKNAKIMRFGYAIEYDFIDPTQIFPTLETKAIRNLFLAGQINGTTGYEEAAGQGLVVGINAALRIKNREPFILERTDAYLGVLIDDLVTKGTEEPYRLFTSRVEHRLVLRQDNADLRLGEYGYRFGLISRIKIDKIRQKKKIINSEIKKLNSLKHGNATLAKILKRPNTKYRDLLKIDSRLRKLPEDITVQVELEIKYEGYIQREKAAIEKLKRLEHKLIPADFSYHDARGMKKEACEKLLKIKPRSLGQAMRISGVTAADLSVLLLQIERETRQGIY